MEKRESFNSKWGFILACIGSAVGMGNLWMFPTRVSLYGGGSFLIPYFIFVALIGSTGVIGEMCLGRGPRSGPIDAFGAACETRGRRKLGDALGFIPAAGSLAMAIGYTVVMGWILKYAIGAFTGATLAPADTDGFASAFGSMASAFGNNGWQLAALFFCILILMFGVGSGIENANKLMMPVFFILFVFLGIYVAFQPGAMQGYRYIFRIDPEILADPKTWIFALGQAFFSLSLAGSGTVVYGSYLKSDVDVVSSAKYVAFFDTAAALLAGLVIIPAVFSFGMAPNSGPGLLFITIPAVIRDIPLGRVFAIIFFLAVLFAGITSLMNLLESPVEALQKRLGWSRRSAITFIGVITAAVGIFVEGGLLSAWMDSISIYVIPLGALLAGITMFWICGDKFARNAAQLGRVRTIGKWFKPMTKYVFCGVAVLVYILGIFFGGIG